MPIPIEDDEERKRRQAQERASYRQPHVSPTPQGGATAAPTTPAPPMPPAVREPIDRRGIPATGGRSGGPPPAARPGFVPQQVDALRIIQGALGIPEEFRRQAAPRSPVGTTLLANTAGGGMQPPALPSSAATTRSPARTGRVRAGVQAAGAGPQPPAVSGAGGAPTQAPATPTGGAEAQVDWAALGFGSQDEGENWARAFAAEHGGNMPWEEGTMGAEQNLQEHLAALQWGQQYQQATGRTPNPQEYSNEWFRTRFGLGPNWDISGAARGGGMGFIPWGPQGWLEGR